MSEQAVLAILVTLAAAIASAVAINATLREILSKVESFRQDQLRGIIACHRELMRIADRFDPPRNRERSEAAHAASEE